MVTVRATVRTTASVDDVVAVILDADLAPLWTDGLERLELVSGIPGEPGCVGKAHYRGSLGRTTVMTDTLEAVDPGRYYRSVVAGGPITATVETFLEPAGSGTEISILWTGDGSHLVANVTMRMLQRGLQRRVRDDLEALARLAESSGPADGMGPATR